jgi:ubiquinone/menaquinone biosynthesis C-methylase UbiE
MATTTNPPSDLKYLDMQAYVGITKHNGGLEATSELLALCHIDDAREVLNVGCGIGAGGAYIAKTHGRHVVGVDISEKMIGWSRKRASQEHIESRVEFQVADILDLPFEAGRFDLVIVESVIAFVEDKERAIRECVRVTGPGGYVGLNESLYAEEPSPEIVAMVRRELGVDIPTADTWQRLWAASGLEDRVLKVYRIDPRKEIRGRLKWIGARWTLAALGRLFRLYLTVPSARGSLRRQLGAGSDSLSRMGYGLFAGRKQVPR